MVTIAITESNINECCICQFIIPEGDYIYYYKSKYYCKNHFELTLKNHLI